MSSLWDRTQVKKLVVHYLGVEGLGPVSDKEELLKIANPYSYQYPEYDFGILADGSIITMRPLSVVGAHTQADRAQYNYAPNWWNKNSASIVIAYGDAMQGPSPAQVTALASFLIEWCRNRGATFDDIYPHCQITQTVCPGVKSVQLGIDLGLIDWDSVESAVRQQKASMAKVLPTPGTPKEALPPVVVYFTDEDKTAAVHVAAKVGGGIESRDSFHAVEWEPFYVVGGPSIDGAVKVLSGERWEDTVKAVLEFLDPTLVFMYK